MEKPVKILCVDDDNLVRAVTCDLLRDLGHEVEDASGSREAMHRLDNPGCDIDLLLTDIQMNGPEGQQLAAIARRRRPDLPVIYFTGYSAMNQSAEARSEVLRKPCTLGTLQAAIKRVCAAA